MGALPIVDSVLKNDRVDEETIVLSVNKNDIYKLLSQAYTLDGYRIWGLILQKDKKYKQEQNSIEFQINQAKILMQESVYGNQTPEDVAKSLNISYSRFRSLFKKITGTSPGKYINELKIKELKYALISSNESVKEISYKFNFANPDYLTLYFKQRTGLTPTEYRKNNTNQKLIL